MPEIQKKCLPGVRNHLSNNGWQTIPNKGIKKCCWHVSQEGLDRTVLLQPTGEGIAFDSYGTGEFFTELLKKFSKEKYEEGRKLEYNKRRQTRMEDPRRYYTDKLRPWI